MKYLVLLRGINVGGKNMIKMNELRAAAEQAGLQNVSTYINSGNLLCESLLSKDTVANKLSQTIHDNFGLQIDLVILSADEVTAIVKILPEAWTNDSNMKCDVMFLQQGLHGQDIVGQLPIKPDIEHIMYAPGAIIWSVNRADVTKSGMLRLVGTKAYKQLTIRNCNTLRKLADLMAS